MRTGSMGIHALRVSERFAPHLEVEKAESHNSRTHAFWIVLADISLPFFPLISNPFSSSCRTKFHETQVGIQGFFILHP
jgi:hypothetical protein